LGFLCLRRKTSSFFFGFSSVLAFVDSHATHLLRKVIDLPAMFSLPYHCSMGLLCLFFSFSYALVFVDIHATDLLRKIAWQSIVWVDATHCIR
jgi:hypothetical protein